METWKNCFLCFQTVPRAAGPPGVFLGFPASRLHGRLDPAAASVRPKQGVRGVSGVCLPSLQSPEGFHGILSLEASLSPSLYYPGPRRSWLFTARCCKCLKPFCPLVPAWTPAVSTALSHTVPDPAGDTPTHTQRSLRPVSCLGSAGSCSVSQSPQLAGSPSAVRLDGVDTRPRPPPAQPPFPQVWHPAEGMGSRN